MRLTLTPEQSQRWEEGGFAAWRTEEDCVELADRMHVHEPVIVMTDAGKVAFAITAGEVSL